MRALISLTSVVCFTGALALGCADGKAPGTQIDGGLGPDAPEAPIDAGGGGLWEECDDSSDCQPGMTCFHPLPSEPGHCTTLCDGDCPEGFACQTEHLSDTIEADICVPAEQTFCNVCNENSECGDSSDMCVLLSAGRFCSIDCKDDPTVCPSGFTCRNLENVGDGDVWQCMPVSGICCIDDDGDLRGEGGGCLAGDCDDGNDKVYDDAAEVCDGFDNDCMGGVDVDPSDCAGPDCKLGPFGFVETPAQTCGGAAGCQDQNVIQCGLYTCDGGDDNGDHCAIACDGENDGKCVPPAHCEASVCVMDLVNGSSCDEDSDCQSSHCQNGFCCATGDCCALTSDCPTAGVSSPVCNDTATCQGEAGMVSCQLNQCVVMNGLANDSACDSTVVANDCGFYKEIRCSGASNQTPPACPTMCNSNADCDANAYCDQVSKTCQEDLNNGQACPFGGASCKSGHCQNGFCCASGDCCATESDCPASYSAPPQCDTPSACQGTVDAARCLSNQCSTAFNVPDDRACTGVADTCGSYPSVSCNGAVDQIDPPCATSCTTSADCDANAYCNASGACVPDEPNGGVCEENGDCQSAHCNNGFCCTGPGTTCCGGSDAHCDGLDLAAVCDSQTSCQGSKVEGTCGVGFVCGTTVTSNDSACGSMLQSNDCGPYPAVFCSGMTDQPSNQGGLCATSCMNDMGCDVSAHCNTMTGMCEPDVGQGGFCTTQNDCGSGLTCVDNVCCNSACNGACMACDLTGSVGTCTAVPSGQDPDAECGAVDCSGFFHGFAGDQCRRKADVSAAAATCNGAGACKTQAQECTASGQGPTVLTCNAQCQDPTAGTCTGTTAGQCSNLNLGNQTCGDGVCQVTVPVCVSGAPNACVPNSGASTTETCNNVDDNCDGSIDNGSFGDGFESNNSCSTFTTLPQVVSEGMITRTATLYPSGDTDHYTFRAHETDSSCGCGTFSFDEDYKLFIT